MERLIGLAFDWFKNELPNTYLVFPFPVAPEHLIISLGLTHFTKLTAGQREQKP